MTAQPQLEIQADDIPNSFLCPITQLIMQDPVILVDGHTYEKEAIQRWFASGHSTSPLTNQSLGVKSVKPNYALKHAIAEWLSTRKEFLQCQQNVIDRELAIALYIRDADAKINKGFNLKDWLERLDLPQYYDILTANGFDDKRALSEITESNLSEMKVLLGHRHIILDAVKKEAAAKEVKENKNEQKVDLRLSSSSSSSPVWAWNPQNKGINVSLKKNLFTVCGHDALRFKFTSDRSGALGEKVMDDNEHYWEITIDGGYQAMIGVARPTTDMTVKRLYETSDVAFIAYNGQLYGRLGTPKTGIKFERGDVLGILLIKRSPTKFDMSICKNRANPVKVFTNIPSRVVAACELWSYADQITLHPNVVSPFSKPRV